MVSQSSIAWMFVAAALQIGVPIALYVVFRRRAGVRLLPVLVGALVFLVFPLLLESLLHQAVFARFPELRKTPAAYMLYAGLTAGIFEETGRVCGFWTLRRVDRRPDGLNRALGYGIGHGGLESLALAGAATVSNLVLAFSINRQGMDAVLSSVPQAAQDGMRAQMNALVGTAPGMFLVSGLERVMAIALQIVLSVLVWMVVSKMIGKIWFPAAVLLHAAADFGAALYQAAALPLWAAELWMLAVTVCAGALVVRLYRTRKTARAPAA